MISSPNLGDQEPECENESTPRGIACEDMFNCCSCGGNNCGCRYCFDCNACSACLGEDDE